MPPPNLLDEIDRMTADLTFEEQLALMEKLAQRLRSSGGQPSEPVSLYGRWKGKLPDDGAVEEAIRDARTEWKKDFEGLE